MLQNITCPKCGGDNTMFSKKRNLYICEDCDNKFKSDKTTLCQLRIFLSYGHDHNEELVRMIKADLEKRGHDVWFDNSGTKESGIVPGVDWRRAITDGIIGSNRVLSFLSKHSTRDPGVCLDEISIAIGVRGGNIQTILVESETEVKAPPSISHIQWLDMHNWEEKKSLDTENWEDWYKEKLKEITDVIESDESIRFAGEIETLAGYLKPITSDSRISQLLRKGFVGRGWLTEAVEQWRIDVDQSSRLFWIMGHPGVGKSAYLAHLCHFGKDKVIAVQFCEHDKPDHSDAARVICSLAFQLATRLPDYRKLLLTLPEINRLETKGASELFDYLLANPLNQSIEGGRERYLILIDALDEAKVGERNPLVEMLAQQAPLLPKWLCIVVTSRSEKNVTDPLQGLNPFILDTDSETNKEDIRQYLSFILKEQLELRSDARNIVEQVLMKSEGVFLYVERVCNDIKEGNLSLDRIEDFPTGLGGIYLQFFQRQFPDTSKYRREIQPALRAILVAMEPIPVQIIGKLFNWKREELNDFTRLLGSLFPVLQESEQKVIKQYHKSIVDWITHESTAGAYFIYLEEGHKLLANYGWQQFLNGIENMDPYFIKWLPRHLLKLERWEDLVNLLCNLEYIQGKAVAKLTYQLVEDFNLVLQSIPDNAKYIRLDNERKVRLDKYIRDLIAYAQGKDKELKIPISINPWSKDGISSTVERMKTNHDRLNRLKDFKIFLGKEAENLQNYAQEFPHFATQQAWNFVDSGSVGIAAEKSSQEIIKPLLLRSKPTRPPYSPLPYAIQSFKGHTDFVYAVCITPDSRIAISGSDDYTCKLWNLDTGESLHTMKVHTSQIRSVSMTPDGSLAISGSFDKTCILWDLNSGKALQSLRGHSNTINAVSMTPDGQRAISGSSDKTCILWDLGTGKIIYVLKGHTNTINAVSLTPNSQLAISGSSDNNFILWDLTRGEMLKIFNVQTKVMAVSITPDGKQAIFGLSNNTCILWNVSTGNVIQIFKGHIAPIRSVSITPDGKKAISGSEDNTCIVWDITSGKVLQTLKGHTSFVNSVSIAPDGIMAFSGSNDKTCILWNLNLGKDISNIIEHNSSVHSISITPDGGQAISGSYDGSCILWDLNTGKKSKILKKHDSPIYSLSISSNCKHAISGLKDSSCVLWELDSGKTIQTLKKHTSPVHALSITPDGKRAISCSDDHNCIIWDLTSGKMEQILEGHTDWVRAVSVTPDGKRAITSSYKTCILWNLVTGESIRTLNGHTAGIYALSVTPDGKKAISGSSDKTCILWDLTTGMALDRWYGHTSGVNTIAVTSDGSKVLSGSKDNTCIMWNIENGEKISLFVAYSSINAVCCYTDGIIGGEESGKTFILKFNKELEYSNKRIVTIKQIWDFEMYRYLSLSADCPLCGHRFAPPASVLATIYTITKKAGLKSEQSPCLELSDDAWENSGLQDICPQCGGELKFNPFVAGGDE